ncbi:MAG: carbamoyltransferase HypF [Thermoplasmata archaeon]
MKLIFRGVVQGVGFRPSVYRAACALGISGYIRNNGSNVEAWIDKNDLTEVFIERVKKELSSLARIDEVIAEDVPPSSEYISGKFLILNSTEGKRDSPIPPDTALCDDCANELFDEKNRRYMYPFTNCTNCGARFSVIEDVPYDREKTSMKEFQMCEECKKEYHEPSDRRFYAQTTSCPKDGPRYEVFDKNGDLIVIEEVEKSPDAPIKYFAKCIDDGKFGVMKNWGGMHIICRLDKVKEMRRWYGRESKPFAVMVRDIETARKYADLTEYDVKVLTSYARPITLVKKKKNKINMLNRLGNFRISFEEGNRVENDLYDILEDVSPGLDSIGLYLPYGAAQYILFKYLKTDAIISTSANVPGEPMIIENKDAFVLGADVYLLHNRRIVSRCDDSVVIPYRGREFLIRRSRGYVPLPIKVGYNGKVLSIGAQQNLTSSISKGGLVYISQYIGNAERYEVQRALKNATEHMMKLAGVDKLDCLCCDMHPGYSTRRYAKSLEERFGLEGLRTLLVQHHHAHAVSLMVDAGLGKEERLICVTVDGAGYGNDGTIWGGEVLDASMTDFERVCSLELLPMPGGDLAVENPKMMAFGICEKLGRENEILNKEEYEFALVSLKKAPVTSSFGRVLDAVSYFVGACRERTYDGEPAMRLERYLAMGEKLSEKSEYRYKDEFKIEIMADSEKYGMKRIRTLPLFGRLLELIKNADERAKMEISYSFVDSIVGAFADSAIERARSKGIKKIGISGGVSYDIPIVDMFRKRIEREGLELGSKLGLELVLHSRVPNGDGGISVGQNAVGGYSIEK